MEKNTAVKLDNRTVLKFASYIMVLFTVISLLVGCGQTDTTKPDTTKPDTTQPDTTQPDTTQPDTTQPDTTQAENEGTDGVSTASIVDTDTAFVKSVSKDGNWITAITKDVTIASDVVVEGEFINGKKDDKGKDIIQRKIALYAQDADRNITDRYTLTAPKLTIKSPNASLQHGKFVGDIYVEATGFQLVDNTVEGNIYFTSEDIKNSFTMDASSSVTGVQEIK